MEQDFLKELNTGQLNAVVYNDGPSLVIAGAGSGKTRVLTYKIAYLLQQGFPAESLLALTFTNKAAREMKERIAKMVGWQTSRRLWMGTFHSIFSRILRSEADKLGFTPDFTIYDASDSKSLIKAIIKELSLDDKLYKASIVQAKISQAKNNLLSPQAYKASGGLLESDRNAKIPLVFDIYARYTNRCKAPNAMDFDDLLLYTNVLFRDFPDVLEKYKSFFQFILVDEYQDTNFAQHLIVKRLAENHHKLCVVGDDAQSIYSFRGANIDNILNFKTTYPECQVFKLEQNYRSTQNIVNAANSLIEKNKGQIRKRVFSQNDHGERITVHSVYSDYDEGFTITNAIATLQKGSNYDDFAILYRTNAQSRVLEEALRKNAIPYKIYGGLSFYQRKEIKDVIAYLRLVINPHDEEALKRIINVPVRGIGDTTLNKLLDCAHLHQVSAWTVLSDILAYNLPVNVGTAQKLTKFRDSIAPFQEQVYQINGYDLAHTVVKASGLMSDAKQDNSPENLSRVDNMEELLKAIHEFCEMKNEEEGQTAFLPDFLSEVSLLTDQDQKNDDTTQRVTLMTVHASKGLEYKHIFVVGMEEELFPSSRSLNSERDLEEERRLFYVAITRAKETCHISYAKSRFRNGKSNFCNPSRFINDIDPQFLILPEDMCKSSFAGNRFQSPLEERFFSESTKKTTTMQPFQTPKKLKKIAPAASTTNSLTEVGGLCKGALVEHAIFGKGVIVELNGSGTDVRAIVDFEHVGYKNLLLKYAKLNVL
ncbi:MAG: exodeoxyribonuclease V subunit gamma [Paludibacteraceae bacterium]|nr:exodeoxyribonuclease V subunit gamma [Paludibacteraceae bacterium]MBN2787429.1 exodeoxyribonuclease V subunit gamma [Paludibacteraceae bacterium]